MENIENKLLLSPINSIYWMLMQEFKVDKYIIPSGFITDFASTPKFMWVFLPPWDNYGTAAILHDYFYGYGIVSRKEADKIMLRIMEISNVSKFKRQVIYSVLRLVGWHAYNSNKAFLEKHGVPKQIYLDIRQTKSSDKSTILMLS